MPRDHRSVKEQVKSGLLIAGELVGGFLVFILAAKGLIWLFPPDHSAHFPGPAKAWIALSIAAVAIFSTAERWAGIIPGFFLIRGLMGGLFATAFPIAASAHSQGISRLEAAELAIYCLCVIVLLWRFLPPHRAPATVLDRVALTVYAFSVAAVWALPRETAFRAPLLGAIPLLIAWLIFRRQRPRRIHKT